MTSVIPLPAAESGGDAAGGEKRPALPAQVRVLVHVGDYFVESVLTERTPIQMQMPGLLRFLQSSLDEIGASVSFETEGLWTLAVEGGKRFPLTSTLAAEGVTDGNRLILAQTPSDEVFRPQVEDRSVALSEFVAVKYPQFVTDDDKSWPRALGLIALVVGSIAVAGLTYLGWRHTSFVLWWAPIPALLTLIGLVAARSAENRRDASQVSYAVGLATLPQAFILGFVAVPAVYGVDGQASAANLFAGAVLAAALAVGLLVSTKLGAAAYSCVAASAVIVVLVSALRVFLGVTLEGAAALAVLLGMLMVASLAPKLALRFAGVRPPNLPSPGENISEDVLEQHYTVDDDDEYAAQVVDDEYLDPGDPDQSQGEEETLALDLSEDTQLEKRSRQANKYLTGLYLAGLLVVVTASVWMITPGAHYAIGEMVLAAAVTLSLYLQGRTLVDRVHVVSFYVAGFATGVGSLLRVAAGYESVVWGVATLVAGVALVICSALAGIRLYTRQASPPMKRTVQIVEYLVRLALIPGLAFWIAGIYAFARDLF